jgi:cytochrome c
MKKPYPVGPTNLLVTMLLISFTGESLAADQISGETFAKDNCARCHAIDKSSASPYHKALPFRVIAGKYKLEFLQEALAEGIVTGHNVMPEFILSPKQIDDLLAYFQTLK